MNMHKYIYTYVGVYMQMNAAQFSNANLISDSQQLTTA